MKMALSATNARASADLGPILAAIGETLRQDDVLALYIMHEKRKGAASAHAEHIKSIPSDYDQVPTHSARWGGRLYDIRYFAAQTIFWTADELEELRGSSVYTITQKLLVQTRADHAALLDAVAPYPLLAEANFTYEEYCWALASIWSRSMDMQVPAPGSKNEKDTVTTRGIFPVADMFNTSVGTQACHYYDPQDECLKIVASRDAVAGEQLFIGYGDLNAARSACAPKQ
eukprot:SAG31_NODE_2748_length_5147_cov_2.564184_2_plen_230_part_00